MESIWILRGHGIINRINRMSQKPFPQRSEMAESTISDCKKNYKGVQYNDERIADYMRSGENSYNIRHILKPEIAARKIGTQLVKLEMAQGGSTYEI